MEEGETVAEFHAKLCDISNESYALGKTYSNTKLVRKVLAVLPRAFKAKVTSIEEVHDVEELDLDELIGSLQNYEMTLKRWGKEKDKGSNSLAFVHKEEVEKGDMLDGLTEDKVAFLTKNYAKFLKRNMRRGNLGGKENGPKKIMPFNQRSVTSQERKNREIRCRECDGFGHIQAECANTLKKKKAMAVTWSDSDEEKEESCSEQSDQDKCVVAFMASSNCKDESENDESGESNVESLDQQSAYEQMYDQWVTMIKKVKQVEGRNQELILSNKNLEGKVKRLLREIDDKNVQLQALFFEALKVKKPRDELGAEGFRTKVRFLNKCGKERMIDDPSSSKSRQSNASLSTNLQTQEDESWSRPSLQKNFTSGRFVPVCHFCNKRGHIRPKCFKLQNYLQKLVERKEGLKSSEKIVHVPFDICPNTSSEDTKACVAHISLSAFKDDQWYFDSGCSRHMTGNRHLLINYQDKIEGAVTFGDANKGAIQGKGELLLKNLPSLKDVLYVEGLKANLISISQLCDSGYLVNFSNSCCSVVSSDGRMVLTGKRSIDNCYKLDSEVLCNRTILEKFDLWHHRMGHLNYRDLQKLIKLKAVRGVPECKVSREKVCAPCQLGKQTRVSHPTVKFLQTSRVLELLHVDLMGPMQTESISGKRYVMVCVDDYSRYSWVNFIREKSDTFGVFSALVLKLQNEKLQKVMKVHRVRSDHGKEFENSLFAEFCDHLGIAHEFSAPKTPQQNGVVERKNRTLQEMARVMLCGKKIATRFWAEAVNIACYISNRVHLRTGTTQTAYEI
ncbi:uncharacterized protein LOC133814482 [Humulus lupulus]|uniref:uncharacterized protein LOC133814482 n=1 Tax=Humulus lupulus TaxID=3486 RepID=UPI002B409DD8|nr:uncharacterized protein LOC133814482 [Humulus lupulus]